MDVTASHLPQRFYLLQILRGIAALMVVYEHLIGGMVDILHENFIIKNFMDIFILKPALISDNGGALAVMLFFLLSGFVITMSAMKENRLEFGIKRFFRIYPPIIFSVAMVSIVYCFIIFINESASINYFSTQWPSLVATDNFGISSIIRNVLLIDVNLNAVMWTLRIEILFYGIVFLLLPLLHKKPNLFYSIISINLLCFVIIDQFYKDDLFFAHAVFEQIYFQVKHTAYLFLGSLLYMLMSRKIAKKEFTLFSALLIFLSVNVPLQSSFYLAYLIFSLVLLLESKIQAPKSLTFIGDISYSIYLNHQTVGTIAIGLLLLHFGFSQIHFGFYVIIALILSAFLALLSYFYIERPSQKFARHMIGKFNLTHKAAT